MGNGEEEVKIGNPIRVVRIRSHMQHVKKAIIFVALLISALFATPPAMAQFFGDSHTKASLHLENAQSRTGETIRGVLLLKMDPHWHTYWKNPGDTGLATEIEWELPEGWEASEIRWPAPSYLVVTGLASHAYEDSVALGFELTPPADAVGEIAIKGKAKWLECEESCIPGEAELEASIKLGDTEQAGPDATMVETAFAKLPQKLDGVGAQKTDTGFSLTLPASLKDAKQVHFFADSPGQVKYSAPQVFENETSPTLKLIKDPDATEVVQVLSGTLVVDGEAYEVSAQPGDKPAPPAPPASVATIAISVLGAFVGGMVLNLMPCVFPVLSLKVLSIVEQSREEGSKAWHHGAVFTAGVLVSFWILSGILLFVRAAGEQVGWGYHLQNPVMIAGLALLFLLIALNLFGVFEVGESLTQVSNVADKKEGFAQSFWSGVLTTLAATPCSAPLMGSAVGFALSQSTFVALLVFTALALGVAAPYFTLTMFPKLLDRMPRPGAWMVTFKQVLAFPMMAAVIWLVWVFGSQMGSDRMGVLLLLLLSASFSAWVYGKWGSSFDPKIAKRGALQALIIMVVTMTAGYQISQPDKTAEKWLDYSPELVAELKASGKPFFLDFTADWCTSCKANELVTLSRDSVQDKFDELGVTLVKGDWTNRDEVITQALQEYGRAGVPLYVLHPGGGKEPQILPEVIVPSMVLNALESVK